MAGNDRQAAALSEGDPRPAGPAGPGGADAVSAVAAGPAQDHRAVIDIAAGRQRDAGPAGPAGAGELRVLGVRRAARSARAALDHAAEFVVHIAAGVGAGARPADAAGAGQGSANPATPADDRAIIVSRRIDAQIGAGAAGVAGHAAMALRDRLAAADHRAGVIVDRPAARTERQAVAAVGRLKMTIVPHRRHGVGHQAKTPDAA